MIKSQYTVELALQVLSLQTAEADKAFNTLLTILDLDFPVPSYSDDKFAEAKRHIDMPLPDLGRKLTHPETVPEEIFPVALMSWLMRSLAAEKLGALVREASNRGQFTKFGNKYHSLLVK